VVNIRAYSPPLDLFTTALLGLFATSGRTIYDGAYAGDPTSPAYPYGILFSLPGGSAEPFPDLDLDRTAVTAVWQVTAVSKLRNQAEAAARVFRDLLCARTVEHPEQLYANSAGWAYPITAPPGWQVITRTPDAALAGVIRTGDTPNAVFSAPFKFSLTIAPA
jgi:hypothetical protein